MGTSSLRRRAQLLALRPDLDVRELRGNVDTRLRKLAEGEYDAIVLAPPAWNGSVARARARRSTGWCPAPGQGCLALEARADDERTAELAAAVTDRPSLARLTAERAWWTPSTPPATRRWAPTPNWHGDELELTACAGLPDGSRWVRDALRGETAQPAVLGAAVAERMLAAGAGDLLAEAEALA